MVGGGEYQYATVRVAHQPKTYRCAETYVAGQPSEWQATNLWYLLGTYNAVPEGAQAPKGAN